jgi:micrococcal nuclease
MILAALLAVATIPSGQSFTCDVARILDGDTFVCASGVRVRLRAIDAPEMPGHCRRGRQCAPGDPYASKAALTRLAYRQTLTCIADGRTHDRVAAWCSVSGFLRIRRDLSCLQFRAGYAVREAKYDRDGRLCR